MMPYIELYYPEDNVTCAFGQSGHYFYKNSSVDPKPKRISEAEYMSAYEEYYNL